MNYEELYAELAAPEKNLKDTLAGLQKLYKAIIKDTESGDLKSLSRDAAAYAELYASQETVIAQIRELTDSFDSREYFDSGAYAEQMTALCRDNHVDVTGTYPVFEMFPYRVRFDTENQDIYIDRKKYQCMRPSSLVQTIKAGQEKLLKAPFNSQTFANELSEAYDMAILRLKKQDGADLYLTSLYKFLVPMGRFRKDYDQQSFAFDIARLYASDVTETKSGRRFQFGPSRNNGKAIRILDREGNEQYLATIRFF